MYVGRQSFRRRRCVRSRGLCKELMAVGIFTYKVCVGRLVVDQVLSLTISDRPGKGEILAEEKKQYVDCCVFRLFSHA